MKKLIFGIALFTLSQAPVIHQAYAERLVTGTVNPNGTSQLSTDDFTIAHPGNGHYIITFKPVVFGTQVPACIVLPLGSLTVNSIRENVSFCAYTIVNLSSIPTDAFHNFMAAPITR